MDAKPFTKFSASMTSTCYYDFEKSPGATPLDIKGKYDFLDNEGIVSKLLEFQEDKTAIVSLNIPIFTVVPVFGFSKICSVSKKESVLHKSIFPKRKSELPIIPKWFPSKPLFIC